MGICVGRADNNNNIHARSPGSLGSPGFTLLELLVAVMIAALLLAIATPSFSELGANVRMSSTANDLLAAVQQARTEAAKRQQTVSLCAIASATPDEPVCSGDPLDQVARRGWLVFVDPNRDCARVPDDEIELDLVRHAPADARISSPARGACISFGPDGFLRERNVAVLLCDERGLRTQGDSALAYARAIALTPDGAARITRIPTDITDVLELTCPAP